MGYRLEVAEVEPEYKICGGKLYGYYGLVQAGDGIEELESWKWLEERDIIDGGEVWTYGCSIGAVVGADDFRQFWALYAADFEKVTGRSIELDEAAQASLENDKDKLITWG